MFRIRAALDQQVEWKMSAAVAREFFDDLRNFAELMPGVEHITSDAAGVAHWLIHAKVPVLGSVRHAFSVFKSVDEPTLIEWSPAPGEKKNFLRYSAVFEEREATTLIRVSQCIELRRQSARELHTLAALAGEGSLSAAVQKVLSGMLQSFLQRARARLESRESDECQIKKKGREIE
jgi:carbon monoxide dehydrogenase subunit G